MLCLKAEGLANEMYSSHGVMLPANLGRSLQRVMHKVGKNRREEPRCRRSRSDPSSSSSGDGTASCSGLDDSKSNDGTRERRHHNMCCYRSQLEDEVRRLQQQLKEEIDLHVALANAITDNARNVGPLFDSPSKLPDKAQDLLDTVATLEITVSKLEEELASLQLQLCRERNERHLAEHHLGCLPPVLPEQPSKSYGSIWEEHISSLRASKFGLSQISISSQRHRSSDGDSVLAMTNKSLDEFPEEEFLRSSNEVEEGGACLQQSDAVELKDSVSTDLRNNPNKLSEEMVRCMRDIFLCLSEPSDTSSKASSSECLPYQPSPVGQPSPLMASSDSSFITSSSQNVSTDTRLSNEIVEADRFDPYGVNGKIKWRNIGCYCMATEVSWMSVGKAQLEYAAKALNGYRSLVEQLAKVNPANLNGNERLAFWINVYNALIMHAYLAYGVPKTDIKLFSLMQKASYLIGGQSINAAEIEFVILKMKPPAHRPQLSLVLALHKFKTYEEQKSFFIDNHEPMLLFALSCGMYSSPAIRVFKANNIQLDLHNSMLDYIRASIGISQKGKLLVPKLLHSYTKGIVEDSLLVDWICRHLSTDQITIVRESTSQRKQRLLGVRSFSIIPYDSRFRYLFLSDDDNTCEKS